MKNYFKYMAGALLMACIVGCQGRDKADAQNQDDSDTMCLCESDPDSNSKIVYTNSVKGHKEESAIAGNFTGHGIDSLYVVIEEIEGVTDPHERFKFYAKSNNPKLPVIELYGYELDTPMLVYEGDLDGDGKDEWGYLHTWDCSQWRYYRVYNFDDKTGKWRFLYYDADNADISLLSTNEAIRGSGLDIVEKGPKPGLIKINGIWGADFEYRDTIVRPTYTPISKDVL